jgi:sulfatase maturation enzyme AslB (radical SAM superfamily)
MSKFFCPLPWIHQFIQADGIKMCCSSSTKFDVTPVEFNQSTYIAEVRSAVANGQVPEDCRSCVDTESQGFSSTRTLALTDWNYDASTVPSEILYLDLRHSNLCNFSCRTCEPAFSSEIAREQGLPIIHLENTKVKADVQNLLPTVKRINFTGGEPLLIKENIQVLERLIEIGNTNCEILITTNGSVMNPKILDLVKQFTSVHWTISLDAVENQAEYIRNGTDWNKLCTNLHSIMTLNHSVGINCVISAYSILGLSNLVEFFKKLKEQYPAQPLELWFNVCESPEFLNPNQLPETLKPIALDQLTKSIELLEQLDSNPIRSLMTLKSLQETLKDVIININVLFENYTNKLDLLREQSFATTFIRKEP